MKNKVIVLSAVAACVSGALHAQENLSGFELDSTYEQILTESLAFPDNEILNEDNPEYDGLEVQVNYHQPVAPNIRGNYITKLETEIKYNQDGDAEWSKVKYVLGEGTIRPQSWGNWFLGYHFAREDFFQGTPYSDQFKEGDVGNSILELQPHYLQATDWGHWGINVGITHESLAGGLFKPRVRPFGSYRVTDRIELFTSWMFFKEMFYKEGNTDKDILETDSALIYHFDRGNVALGYFAKFGRNIDDDSSRVYDDGRRHNEFGEFSELIWKPRAHYRFESGLGITLFGEYGKFEDDTKHAAIGQPYDTFEEWFWKAGLFMEYPVTSNLIVFGEFNHRDGRIKETYTGTNYYETRDQTTKFGMIGLNFLF